MKDIVIVGAGGVGREVSLIIEHINLYEPTWNVLGFIDDNVELWGTELDGHKVLGGLNVLEIMDTEVYVVIGISSYKVKKAIVNRLKGRFKFATIIHPRVLTHEFMMVGEGTIIYEGVILTMDIRIGSHVLVSPKCGIGHDSIIKDYASLLWNVNISGRDVVEEGALIGTGATLIQGMKVGKGSTIGAGAIVLSNIPDGCTAVGVPAKVIKQEVIYEKDIVCNNC